MASQPVAGGYRVTVFATPTRQVPAITLSLAGQRVAFPATAAGQVRQLTLTVPVAPDAGADVVGGASLAGRSSAMILHVGVLQQPAAKRSVTRTLSDGRRVREVR